MYFGACDIASRALSGVQQRGLSGKQSSGIFVKTESGVGVTLQHLTIDTYRGAVLRWHGSCMMKYRFMKWHLVWQLEVEG
mmetsp:Transcript_56516/g.113201  ORF Transcript_56516/g.113201 Transcript_56516/m.113201 type:complete len:80 (+) Transcript_56516:1586-1825(+)